MKTVNDIGDYVYPVKAISILKQHGKSAHESQLVDGFALNCTRASQAMPSSVANAKIALLDFDLRVTKLKLGIQIIVSDPKELEAIRRSGAINYVVYCGAVGSSLQTDLRLSPRAMPSPVCVFVCVLSLYLSERRLASMTIL